MVQEGALFSSQDLLAIFRSINCLTIANDFLGNKWNILSSNSMFNDHHREIAMHAACHVYLHIYNPSILIFQKWNFLRTLKIIFPRCRTTSISSLSLFHEQLPLVWSVQVFQMQHLQGIHTREYKRHMPYC
jgi:hypothetical protein